MPVTALIASAAMIHLQSVSAAEKIPDGVVFAKNIEYSNPDDQHLQLNMAKPTKGQRPVPGSRLHSRWWISWPGREKVSNRLCLNLATARIRGGDSVPIVWHRNISFPQRSMTSKPPCGGCGPMLTSTTSIRIESEQRADRPAVHLAQFLGVTSDVDSFEGAGGNADYSSGVSCVVNFYGPSDFTKSYDASVDAAEVLPLFLGGNLQQQRRRHIQASPLYWVTPDAAATLCIHGTEEQLRRP